MTQRRFEIKEHTFAGQHIRQYAGATRCLEEDKQLLSVKQYIPLNRSTSQPGDITIIGAPAISFPKEMYEPLWEDLLDELDQTGIRVRSIWAVDPSNQGQSGVLNEHTQGDEPTWVDFARDLLYMINLFRDEMPLPIVGIGHSMGAVSLLEVSRMHPRLMSSLILLDPVMGGVANLGPNLVYMSSVRPDLWPSRAAAEESFRSTKSMQNWDPRVMDLWLQHGLRDTPTLLYPEPGNITLSTTKANESRYYGRSWFDPLPFDSTQISFRTRAKYADYQPSITSTHPFYRSEMQIAWRDLPNLNPGCLYLFPEKGPMSTPAAMDEKVNRTGIGSGGSGGKVEVRVDQLVIKDTGHLLPFQKPKECAAGMAKWLERDLKTWTALRDIERANRDDKSVNLVALSSKWMEEAKRNFEKARMKTKAKL